jgi:hypothetical protein
VSTSPAQSALEAALELAAGGLPVFPCSLSKRPTCPTGFKAAVQDPVSVRELWRLHPGVLVGVLTGTQSGIDVLDLDAKHASARAWWSQNHYRRPLAKTVRTRSGGIHAYFAHAAGLRCSVGKIALGVDVRADGGYVIHWPSAGLPVLCDVPPAPWPDWLLAMMLSEPNTAPKHEFAPATALDDSRLAGLARAVAMAPEGQRNSLLYWAGCRVGEAGRNGDVAEAFSAAVLERAAARCGLQLVEARRTIASGMKRVLP